MPITVETLIESMEFRVLIELAEDDMYVAHCLETGAVAEGDTAEDAEVLIKAILENDFRRAIEAGSIKGLISVPAPYDVVVGWYEMKAADPHGVRRIPLAVTVGPNKRDVQSEVRISTGTRKASVA
jgi:predicted RNase H-like HicB family nuclease